MSIMNRLHSLSTRKRSPANLRQRRKYSTTSIVHSRLIAAANEAELSIGDVLEALVLAYIPANIVPADLKVPDNRVTQPPTEPGATPANPTEDTFDEV